MSTKNNTAIKTHLVKNKTYFDHIMTTAVDAEKEIIDGLKILHKINKDIISIFGSHATAPGSADYIHCEETAFRLGKQSYAILTGGGPGIMQAANAGAMRAKTVSIGFKAKLLKREQNVGGKLFTHEYSFKFLFARRFNLAIKSKVLIFYPGGYGTFNELFEYLTLIQTQMTDPVPIIFVNKKYWSGLFSWIKKETLTRGFVGKNYLKNFYFADTTKEVVDIVSRNN